MIFILGLCVIAATVRAVLLRIDVRLALLAAAVALAVISGVGNWAQVASQGESAKESSLMILVSPLMRVVRTFLTTFSDEKFVIPICLAMGFACVLRETQCDEHLVRLLIKAFVGARMLFLPGAILTGVCVNIPLISQAASAVAAGTVLVPLGRALGFPPQYVGAALLLGCSIGGELLNPGSPEVRIVVESVREVGGDVQPADAIQAMRRLLIWHLAVSATAFLLLNRPTDVELSETTDVAFKINFVKAAIPFVPLLLLAVVSPPLQLWRVPAEWLLVDTSSKMESKAFDSRMIGAAMLLGVLLAASTAPERVQGVAKAFFDGAGTAFATIVALIAAANCFGEGVKSVGLAAALAETIKVLPGLFLPLAAIIPVTFGFLSGSGIAATQSLFPLFVGTSIDIQSDPLETGAIVSLGAAAGRTMSPVSAVNLVTSELTKANPMELTSRVALPLLIGMVAVVVIAILG